MITKKTIEVDVYYASDGMSFHSESQALDWEKKLHGYKVEKTLHKMSLKVPFIDEQMIGSEWFLMSTQEQIDYMIWKYVDKRNYHYINNSDKGKIILGDWVAVKYETDSYGEKGNDGLVTLSFVYEQFKNFIGTVDEITVDGKY